MCLYLWIRSDHNSFLFIISERQGSPASRRYVIMLSLISIPAALSISCRSKVWSEYVICAVCCAVCYRFKIPPCAFKGWLTDTRFAAAAEICGVPPLEAGSPWRGNCWELILEAYDLNWCRRRKKKIRVGYKKELVMARNVKRNDVGKWLWTTIAALTYGGVRWNLQHRRRKCD